ncbi:MAG TPA: TetR/AcrR family transcriptional regulator [Nannocystaceae bacterium]|nr:TetR/AcrR family transcriptional regulator [Nannocystaceae bacterium]
MPRATFFNLPAAKRARIVELAIEEFSAHPFREASLSRLVARAGIAKGSLYQYFDNKLDLYRWLLVEEVGRRKMTFLAARRPPAGAGFFGEIAAMIRAGIEFFVAEPRLGRLAASLLEPTADPDLREMSAEIRRLGNAHVAALLRGAQERGEVRADLDVEVAAPLVATILGQGITGVLVDTLGVDLAGLLAEPERARGLGEAERERMIAAAVEFVRSGVGPRA